MSKVSNNDNLNAINSSINNSNLSTFDYTSLDRVTANFVLQETEKIKTLMKQTVRGIIETGERLYGVKQKLKHGEFMAWVENEISCHYSTALHFMRVWQTFGDRKEQISDIGINVSVLYLLSAPSTPEELRTQIVELAKAGNSVSFAEAKRLKKEYTKHKSNNTYKKKHEAITTIDISADSSSALLQASQLDSTEKQQVTGTIFEEKSEAKIWNLGKHLLYCGSVRSPEFRALLPKTVSLNIGFPDSPFWKEKTLFPITAKSTLVFHSVFQDLDLVLLRNIIQKSIELCTDSGEEILFSSLPYPEMLILADKLNCRSFILEPDRKRCQNVVHFWESVNSQY